jgi:hypothetical protein
MPQHWRYRCGIDVEDQTWKNFSPESVEAPSIEGVIGLCVVNLQLDCPSHTGFILHKFDTAHDPSTALRIVIISTMKVANLELQFFCCSLVI